MEVVGVGGRHTVCRLRTGIRLSNENHFVFFFFVCLFCVFSLVNYPVNKLHVVSLYDIKLW